MSNPPVPVFRISLANATLLSGIYLAIASSVELVRRIWNPRWVDRVSLSLEAFPARTLELLGLFEPVRRAWVENKLSSLEVRFIYGFTTVAVIFSLGTLVGLVMWIIGSVSPPADCPAARLTKISLPPPTLKVASWRLARRVPKCRSGSPVLAR